MHMGITESILQSPLNIIGKKGIKAILVLCTYLHNRAVIPLNAYHTKHLNMKLNSYMFSKFYMHLESFLYLLIMTLLYSLYAYN